MNAYDQHGQDETTLWPHDPTSGRASRQKSISEPLAPGNLPFPTVPELPVEPTLPGQPPVPVEPALPNRPSHPGTPPLPSQPAQPETPPLPGQPPAPETPRFADPDRWLSLYDRRHP